MLGRYQAQADVVGLKPVFSASSCCSEGLRMASQLDLMLRKQEQIMASFFSGWIGYGTGLQTGVLQEPTDNAYSRRPIRFSVLENGLAFDLGSGTVGPSSVAWGTLTVAGLFDMVVGGNLLVFFPLMVPALVNAGATYTTASGTNVVFGRDLRDNSGTRVFPAGTVIGLTPDGRSVTANLPVQVSNGVLSAQSLTFGATVTMATLPSQAAGTGSGQLWNNGGIIAVS